MALCEICVRRESKAMRALEALTPSGSEYVDEVERCVQFIRDVRESQHQIIISLTKQRNELRDRLEKLDSPPPTMVQNNQRA